MAGIDVISNAAGELEEAVLQLRMFVQACEQVDDEKCPPWLFIVGGHSHVIHDAVQAYLAAVHQHAIPHLCDLDQFKGGMGGNAPHGDSRPIDSFEDVTQLPPIKSLVA